jgi:hypothetical protein
MGNFIQVITSFVFRLQKKIRSSFKERQASLKRTLDNVIFRSHVAYKTRVKTLLG